MYNNKSSPFQRKYFVILIVSIVTGFIIGFSYNLTQDKKHAPKVSDTYFEQQVLYREQLIAQQERNKELMDERNNLQQKIRDYERSLTKKENDYDELVHQAERLRLLLGYIQGEGDGVRITLTDSEYDPNSINPNDYIVHESHIFKVLTELKISGAEAIAINGQRLTVNSYIHCNGPVITVDGRQYAAPFVIEAVGNPNVLIPSLEIVGGVVDQLLSEKIVVTLEQSDKILMPSTTEES